MTILVNDLLKKLDAIPISVIDDIKTEIETDLSWFCFDDWGNESSTWTEIKKIIDKHCGKENT